MTSTDGDRAPAISRLDRRKAHTRAALIGAAQKLIAEDRLHAPIAEITALADVGMGSFYNHFAGREELYEAAVMEALDSHGALLDRLTAEIADPAARFATSFRLTGRLHRREPRMSRVLLNNALKIISAPVGLGPRARRDLQDAIGAGRFAVTDLDLAMVLTAGAAICLGQLLHDQPDRDDAAATDDVAESLLCALGLRRRDAHRLACGPLPTLS